MQVIVHETRTLIVYLFEPSGQRFALLELHISLISICCGHLSAAKMPAEFQVAQSAAALSLLYLFILL
jgi:hypothetical protein